MLRLSPLRTWFGLAFVASAAVCCLNPQPEPPVSDASSAGPRENEGNGAAGDDNSPPKGAGGTLSGGGGTASVPADPGGSAGGADGGFEGGAAAGGAGPPPNGGTGGSGTGSANGGAGGTTDTDGGEGTTCGACGDVLARGGRPCDEAMPALAALLACCDDACLACRTRIVRGDPVGAGCLACFEKACPDAYASCIAPPPRPRTTSGEP